MAGLNWRLTSSVLLLQDEDNSYNDILAIEAAAQVGLLIYEVSVSFEEGASSGEARVDVCIADDDGTGGTNVSSGVSNKVVVVGGGGENWTFTAQQHNPSGPPPTTSGWTTDQSPDSPTRIDSKYWPITSQAACVFRYTPGMEIQGDKALLVRVTAPENVADCSVIVTVAGEE